MDFKDYFENTDGLGVLSTVSSDGIVNSALYSKPHIMSDDTVAFIMRPRTSLANVQQNPHAVFMYIEKGPGYQGRRIYLEKTGQDTNQEYIDQLRRSPHGHGGSSEEQSTLVSFKVTRIRSLVGDKEDF